MERFVLFVLVAASAAREIPLDEPQFSRFEYEYKVLERLVLLEQRSVELEKRCEQLENVNKEQQKEIERLKQEAQPETVFAEIQLPSKKTVKDGDTIVFTQAVSNMGHGYSTEFGFFEPPVNGTYIFSVSLCTYANSWIRFEIMRDSYKLNDYFVGADEWHTCGTTDSVTYATTSNKIFVRVLDVYNGVIDMALGTSSFKAILVNKSHLY